MKRPTSTEDLYSSLKAIFPEFSFEPDSGTYQEVMIAFTDHFTGERADFSEEQLRSLGLLLSSAVELDDELENAVATCFLEHARQIEVNKALSPFLSKRARSRFRA
jgi:hypothetical protein